MGRNQEDSCETKCDFYEGFDSRTALLPESDHHRVFTMEDLRSFGRERVQCPYYTAREAIKEADVIVFNYLYLLDPQISSSMLKTFAKTKDSIVVFDEAHNIDDVCLEAYTLKLNNQVISAASNNVH
jgi:DNA excision repair protein ERCC-2